MAKKPPKPSVPVWVASPSGYWIRLRVDGDVWVDVPVLGWDSTGPFAWREGAGVRPEDLVRDVFHESASYVHPARYLRAV